MAYSKKVVDKFENKFSKMFANKNPCLATGAGTDALHLAYILSGLKSKIFCLSFKIEV